MNKRLSHKILAVITVALTVTGLIMIANLIVPPIIEYVTILRGREVVYEIIDVYIHSVYLRDDDLDKHVDSATIELQIDRLYDGIILIELYLYDKEGNLLDYGNLTTTIQDLSIHSYNIVLNNVAHIDLIKRITIRVSSISN